VSGYDNTYDSVASNASFANNRGYYAGGNAGYAFSETTQLSGAIGYSYYTSAQSHSDSVTATLGIVYQYSPQLTLSASGGGFWSDTTTTQGPFANTSGRATGGLFGGQFAYAFSKEAQITVSLSEALNPTGAGALGRSDSAGVVFVNRFSDRLTGRLGASYNRTTYPQSQTDSLDYNYAQGEVGLTYQLGERWTLDAGYRYSRAHYTQNSTTPVANAGFVSIGYNWPGASFTDWVGRPPSVQGMPAAGPIPLPESSRGTPSPSEPSPFEPFTIP
jgi:long-subunit fatty acid transport protein